MRDPTNLHSLVNTVLIVLLGFFVFRLSSDLEITRAQIDAMRVESAMTAGNKPNFEEFEKKLADKITKVEGAIQDNRQALSNFQDKSTQVMKRMAEKMRGGGSGSVPVDDIMGSSTQSGGGNAREAVTVAIEPGAPSLVEFPDEITSVEQAQGSSVMMQKFGRVLVFFGGAFVNEQKDSAKITLRNGLSLTLKVRLASADVEGAMTAKLMKMGNQLVLQPGRQEARVYIVPGSQTNIRFSDRVIGGMKKRSAPLTLKNDNNNLLVSVNAPLDPRGEGVLVMLTGGNYRAIRVLPANAEHPGAAQLNIDALPEGEQR